MEAGCGSLTSPCIRWLQSHDIEDLKRKRSEAEAMFRRQGITFAVYGERL